MAEDGETLLEKGLDRYERLLVQVKTNKFWTGDQPGRPDAGELRKQVERLQNVLEQLRDALISKG